MSTNIKVFQIYFKPELKVHCDPAFTPLDNTSNPRPELREWDVWDREYANIVKQDLDYWGFVSWKFKEKTGLTGRQVFDFINANQMPCNEIGEKKVMMKAFVVTVTPGTTVWNLGE